MKSIWLGLGKFHCFFYVLAFLFNGLVFHTYMLLALTALCFIGAHICTELERKSKANIRKGEQKNGL